MRGIELPISTIVIIVIVLVVLLAVIAFFFGVWNPGVIGANLETAKSKACQMLISTGCGNPADIRIDGFDANKDGELNPGTGWASGYCGIKSERDNLAALCECWYGVISTDFDFTNCKKTLCNCE